MRKKRIAFIIVAACFLLLMVSCTDKPEEGSIPANSLPVINSGGVGLSNDPSGTEKAAAGTGEKDLSESGSPGQTDQNPGDSEIPVNLDSPEDVSEPEDDTLEDLQIEETDEIIESEFVIDVGDNSGVGGN